MELTNAQEIQKKLEALAAKRLKKGLEKIKHEIINNELPKKTGSPIANDLVIRQSGNSVSIYITSPVWDYLDKGTGIFNPEHSGKGAGGEIIAYKQKRNEKGQYKAEKKQVLHFKNAQIASALGFPTEDVFLSSVKGIKPKFIFDRYFSPKKIAEVTRSVD